MIRSKLTRRWQTTIPAEVRRALGLRPEQGLLYELRGDRVILRPEGESLMDLAGSLKGQQSAGSKRQERAAARRAVARRVEGERR